MRKKRVTSTKKIVFQFVRKLTGDEDCLYLNVYKPVSVVCSLLPVVVFIHGGGFFFGSANDDVYGPQKAMREDIVLVTVNYRIGVFGFLASEKGEGGLRGE